MRKDEVRMGRERKAGAQMKRAAHNKAWTEAGYIHALARKEMRRVRAVGRAAGAGVGRCAPTTGKEANDGSQRLAP